MTRETALRAAPVRPTTRARPIAALLAVVLLGVALTGCMSGPERTFLTRTNNLRSSYGLRPLQEHGTLDAKAHDWAAHMAATGRLEHSNLTSGLNGLRWSALGENVGMSSPTGNTCLTIHNMFASSPSHRANLLNSGFTHMGVGAVADSRGRVWVAEVFARL